jgi:hypothetical protein
VTVTFPYRVIGSAVVVVEPATTSAFAVAVVPPEVVLNVYPVPSGMFTKVTTPLEFVVPEIALMGYGPPEIETG